MTTDPLPLILDRIRSDPPIGTHSTAWWLDAHKDDIFTLLRAKGIPATAQLIGITVANLRNWVHRRKAPHLSTQGQRPPTTPGAATKRLVKKVLSHRDAQPAPPAPQAERDQLAYLLGWQAGALEVLQILYRDRKE